MTMTKIKTKTIVHLLVETLVHFALWM